MPSSGTTAGRRLQIALLATATAAGVLFALHHLFDPPWQDEAYTLLFYAKPDFLYSFTHYSNPNNHVLFSAVLGSWGQWDDSISRLRMLPLVTFVASLGLLAAATTRIAGLVAATFASLLMATSHVTLDFAAQLRGYGPSWLPVTLALLVFPGFLRNGGVLRGGVLTLSMSACVLIIPTNLLVWAVFVGWAVGFQLLGNTTQATIRRTLFLLVSPLPGVLGYGAIASKMMVVASHPWSAWSGTAVLSNWLTAFARDFWWLAPLLLLGAVSIVREVRTPGANEGRDCRVMQQALLGSALVVPAVRRFLSTKLPASLSFRPPPVLRKGLHSRAMRPFARLGGRRKSCAIW